MKKKNNLNRKILIVLILSSIISLETLLLIHKDKTEPLEKLAIHNQHIQVGNLKLGMTENDVFNYLETKPDEEMCVYGYEFNLKEEGLNLGFRVDNNTLRRITVKNNKDILYGIKNGISLDDGVSIISEAGFIPDKIVNNRYQMEGVFVTLVSKQGEQVDSIIIEVIDNDILEYSK